MPQQSHDRPLSVNSIVYVSPLLPGSSHLVPIAQWPMKLISVGLYLFGADSPVANEVNIRWFVVARGVGILTHLPPHDTFSCLPRKLPVEEEWR